MKYLIVIFFISFAALPQAQTPFITDGQLFAIESATGDFIQLEISNSNGSILVTDIAQGLGADISALAYRYQDRLIYAIDNTTQKLIQIDANGARFLVGDLDLPTDLYYNSGAIERSGNFMLIVGANSEYDQKFFKINLNDLSIESFDVENYDLRISDLAFDPVTNMLYGFDVNRSSICTTNPAFTNFEFYEPIGFDNGIQGVFFNSFNELKGFGSTAYGIASALFSINKSSGIANLNTTGPQLFINDLVSLPYTIELRQNIQEQLIFPCTELVFHYPISNQTGAIQSGISYELKLPAAFTLIETLRNPFNANVEYDVTSNTIQLENFTLPEQLDSLSFLLRVGDVPANEVEVQGRILGIDPEWGIEKWSDDPLSSKYRAPTNIEIIRPAEDSLSVERFICLGQSFYADYSEFGNNLVWHDGTDDPVFEISGPGTYYARSENECIDFEVNYDITFASCPYTISMYYSFEPDTIFPCNELLIKFDIINDSGLTRSDVSISDTLPNYFRVLGTQGSLLGGELVDDIEENIINIIGMDLPVGEHQIIVEVELLEADAGVIYSRSVLSGFPVPLGPFRLSDDPRSPAFDSSYLTIRGLAQDSVIHEHFICDDGIVVLDVRDFGYDPVWDNGSTDELRVVDEVGRYEVQVNNGCDYKTLFFDVQSANQIEILMENNFEIHQGEELALYPIVDNESLEFDFSWMTLQGEELSCPSCLTHDFIPLSDAVYQLLVWNDQCADSLQVNITVDQSRRIYGANIFSPNRDGINDYFYLSSPDFGMVHQFQIIDRWGGLIYSNTSSLLNDAQSGWDGTINNAQDAPMGVYQWRAEIEFIDGEKSWFTGDVTVFR